MPIRLTRTVKNIAILCFAAFLIQQTGDLFLGAGLGDLLGLSPMGFFVHHRYWQLFTYSFLHHDVLHLFFNLMMLAFIGSEMEATWGSRRFLRFYISCALIAGSAYLLMGSSMGERTTLLRPMIGASAPIYGLLMAYGLTFGNRVLLFMMLFPMKAKHFVWVLALLELLTTVYSSGGWVASIGHLTGMFVGWAYIQFLYTPGSRSNRFQSFLSKFRAGLKGSRSAKKRRNSHLKLIVNNEKDFERRDEESENNPKTWH